MRAVRGEASRRRWRGAGAVVVGALFALPLVFMLTGSLRRPGLPSLRAHDLVPGDPSVASYERALELVDLGRLTANSLVVAALVVPATLLVASWAGFALSQLRGRLVTVVAAASVVALMVPVTALVVPRFVLFRTLGLTDTYVPLVAPALLGTSPLYVLVYWWSFSRVPRELWDAGRVDGLTPLAAWRRLGLPLVRPTTVAVGLLAFMTSWGNVFDPLVYLSDPDLFTVPLGIRSLAQLPRTDYSVLLAGACVATLPVLAAFALAQRSFLRDPKGVE